MAAHGRPERTKEELILDALEWLQRYHADGFPAIEPQKLWCTDGVTDSLRAERIHTYGKKWWSAEMQDAQKGIYFDVLANGECIRTAVGPSNRYV